MEEKSAGMEIDLKKLLLAYLNRWWLIVICTVVIGVIALLYSRFYLVPQYRASTTIYVNNMVEGTNVESVSTSSLSASKQLVSTYINIVRSDRVLDKAAEKLGAPYTAGRISGMLSAAQVEETEIFSISVTGPNPEECAKIANVLGEVVPEEIGELIEGSSARVIDRAKVPQYRCAPSYRKNTLYGAIIGCAIAFVYLTIMFLLDVRIKEEDDLTALFTLPILGRIPEFSTAGRTPHYGYGGKSKSGDGPQDGEEEAKGGSEA